MNPNNIKFIGIGAPKCGTTWIYRCLDEHPEICMGRPKEIHFFNNNYNKGLDYYYKHYSHCEKNKLIGEFSPHYLYDKKAAGLIKDNLPGVKLFVILRNPIERTFSDYLHCRTKNSNYYNTFEAALKYDKKIIERSKYAEYLKYYVDLFGQDNFLVLIYENLKANPKNELEKLFSFIGADNNFLPASANIKYNTAVSRFSKRSKKIKKKIFGAHKWLRQYNWGRLIIAILKKFNINIKLYKTIDSITVKNKKPEIYPATRNSLQKFFQPEIKKTEKLIGCPVEEWR